MDIFNDFHSECRDIAMESAISEKFKLTGMKLNSAFKSFWAKLKSFFDRHKDEEKDDQIADAQELFGFGKSKAKYDKRLGPTDEVCAYIIDHEDELRKKWNVGNECLVCTAEDDVSDLVRGIAMIIKQNMWDRGSTLIALKHTNEKGSCVYGIVKENLSNPNSATLSLGYLTLDLSCDPKLLVGKNKNAPDKFEATLIYHPIWMIDEPDSIGQEKKIVFVGSFEFTVNKAK